MLINMNQVNIIFYLIISCCLFFCHFAYPAGLPDNKVGKFIAQEPIVAEMQQKIENAGEATSKANYPEAYAQLWEVLRVADSIKNDALKFKAFKKLAMLYAIFNQGEKSLACVDSMFYYFQDESEQVSMNYSAALINRMNGQYDCAAFYLNQCAVLLDAEPIRKKIYLVLRQALLEINLGDYQKAEEILLYLSTHIPGASISLYHSIWADLYLARGNKKKALAHLMKSLDYIAKQNTRVGLSVNLLKKASNINMELGNHKLAYEQLKDSKELGDKLFGSRSEINKGMIEIRDSYRKAILQHQKVKQEEQLKLLNLEKEKLNQRLVYALALIFTIIVAFLIVYRKVKHKSAAEKQLEHEYINNELEVKKKELTVTALRLIEKDQLLEEVKSSLDSMKGGIDETLANQIKHVTKNNSTNTWKEFEARFVQVNNEFYTALNTKHEGLSTNEYKLCALIKLNFSSKEMAQFMGISVDGIHKARYRLRKKLGLSRDDNLATYINSIK